LSVPAPLSLVGANRLTLVGASLPTRVGAGLEPVGARS